MSAYTSSFAVARTLSVSVVTYRPDRSLLKRTFSSLLRAFHSGVRAHDVAERLKVILIDNDGGLETSWYGSLSEHPGIDLLVLSGHGNVGYGAGHNLALPYLDSTFHLVLNPDVELGDECIESAMSFFRAHSDVGLLAPCVRNDQGGIEYLCRRYPSVLTLLVRGVLPGRWRSPFAARLASYELRDRIGATGEVLSLGTNLLEPPIISGCFMLFRTSVFMKVGGFDPRYFLYFEDYDLSLRTAMVSRIVYVPEVQIVHSGGGASRKGWAHIQMFASSAFRFFCRFGWKWF